MVEWHESYQRKPAAWGLQLIPQHALLLDRLWVYREGNCQISDNGALQAPD